MGYPMDSTPGMSNLFLERAALQTKLLTGPQSHQYNKKRLVPAEIMGKDQRKRSLLTQTSSFPL